MIDRTKTVCVLPWNSHFITNQSVMLCCNSGTHVLGDDNRLLTPAEFNDIGATKFMKKLKADMLAGVKNSSCDRCWLNEPNSFRNNENRRFAKTFQTIIAAENLEIDMPLEYLAIDVGNQCNLACRMCAPHSSSLIAKEWSIKPLPGKDTFENLRPVPAAHLMKNDFFVKMLEQRGSTLTHLYIFGGEPFLGDEFHMMLLEKLVDLGYAKNIRISYTSNGTTTNLEKFLKLWSHFKGIGVQVSADGFEEAYEYIRWPMSWEKFTRNFKELRRISSENIISNFDITIASTVQALTISSLDNLLNYLKHESNLFMSTVTLIPVNDPKIMSLASVPDWAMNEIMSRWTCEEKRVQVENIFKSFAAEDKKESFTKFKEYMLWQDDFRSQSLFKTHPYMESWYEK